MQKQPFDTFGTNNCVKISDHTYFSPDHFGGTAMTLRHMKIFVAVYQQKSITLASNSLHLAQPSVSLAIRLGLCTSLQFPFLSYTRYDTFGTVVITFILNSRSKRS